MSVSLPCVLKVKGKANPARILDLSPEGAFVQIKDPPPSGTGTALVLRLKRNDREVYLELGATVRYSGRFLQSYENFFGCGIRFESPSLEQLALLDEILLGIKKEPERKYGLE